MNATADIAWLLIQATGLFLWIGTIWMAVELLEGVVS